MTTAKSLKKLRSASTAFLEDGGSLLHGVDGLLRDILQTLADLQEREETLVEREIALEDREVCLNTMLKQLADNVSSLAPNSPPTQNVMHPTMASLPESSIPTVEAKLVNELTELQSTVAEIVAPAIQSEPMTPVVATNPTATMKLTIATSSNQRFSNNRRKRRR